MKLGGVAPREQDLLAGEGDGGEQEGDEGGQEKGPEEQDAAALLVTAAQPAVPSEEHPLELDVRARRLSTLRPSSVTTLVLCHDLHIVLQTPVRETGPAVPMCVCASKAQEFPRL